MKKITAVLTALFLCAGILTGCAADASNSGDTISVVCTSFPEYDWVRTLLGDSGSVEVTLLEKGVDIHSYQPNAEELAKIYDCDLFIYTGGESEAWSEKAIEQAQNENMISMSLLDTLGNAVKEETALEGMEADSDEEPEPDEHVWLSLKNARVLCGAIAKNLEKIDPADSDTIKANQQSYDNELASLDEDYTQAVRSAARNEIIVADRFPFRYLCDDYGITAYAAFSGCSSETEASFQTVAFLAQKADEIGTSVILTTEGSGHQIAEAVLNNAGNQSLETAELDSMQTVTQSELDSGKTYFGTMCANLESLKKALD